MVFVVDKPQITTAPDALYKLVSGKASTITCKFDKEPDTVKWEYTPKGGAKVEITKASPSGGLSLDGTNLKIASVDVKSEGATLTCIGSNRFGETKANSKIETVFGMFHFARTSLSSSVLISDELNICIFM